MDKTRQNKVARLLQKDLADIFQKQAQAWFSGAMVSVTVVRVTPDLSLARVYLSLFPTEKKDAIFDAVQENASSIRGELGKRVRNQLRKIPELQFFIDDSLDYAERIDQLLKK